MTIKSLEGDGAVFSSRALRGDPMLPLVIIGVAAVFLSGCFSRKAEEKAEPTPAPAEPPSKPIFDPVSAPLASPVLEANPSSSDSTPPSSAKKLSPKELQEMGENLRKIIEIQKDYGLSCPPPEKLPAGVKCEELYENPRMDLFDPSSPERFRRRIQPQSETGPKVQQI